MPELPEVETVRNGLAKLLPGRVVADVWHDWPKSFPNAPADVAKFLINAKIKDVKRRGKVLIIGLSSDYSLVIHLKMTGQLVFLPQAGKQSRVSSLESLGSEEKFGGGHPTDSLRGNLPDKSTRVVLDLTDGSKLFFNDQRKFGWMRLLPDLELPEIDFLKKAGPEPLEDDFTVKDFIERLMTRKNSTAKAVLLDQTVIAGVGNIYADESLFLAKIHSSTKVADIPRTKLVALYNDLRQVLNSAIENGGSTDRNYVNAEGKKGSYIKIAQVFRREGQPCPRCGTEIVKIRVAGRGTHICPRCQKAPQESK
ncbi:DNA-formamidopyrimidine glycosylase [Candidatus Saccharibacteria bacterium RIFCSPHIGHO2_01_FULL_49_21]|nr:MAG: DNA-formamidopyrimidine glycosylase [Candidatus Saccharibacteria bacterium RIFCSPHIGHO2_01_FULL_49_21]OGL38037.1 MAG: DNA-formamidopyrimidine glycosylase [Candidatus Saccharibacteria bacterium RIFCSPLOWO2_01_FULL_49_22]